MKFAENHPRMITTNTRMPARIRLFVTLFVDGTSPNLKGKPKMIHPISCQKCNSPSPSWGKLEGGSHGA